MLFEWTVYTYLVSGALSSPRDLLFTIRVIQTLHHQFVSRKDFPFFFHQPVEIGDATTSSKYKVNQSKKEMKNKRDLLKIEIVMLVDINWFQLHSIPNVPQCHCRSDGVGMQEIANHRDSFCWQRCFRTIGAAICRVHRHHFLWEELFEWMNLEKM